MSLLINMLSSLVITFLPRSKRPLISSLQSPSAMILEPPKIKSANVSTVSPFICHEVMGPDAMILVFWMLSFKPTFSLFSFTFIKRLFSSSSLSTIRVVSSAYLRLLIFLPAILIPACVSHWLFCLLFISVVIITLWGAYHFHLKKVRQKDRVIHLVLHNPLLKWSCENVELKHMYLPIHILITVFYCLPNNFSVVSH